ncbi:SMP-30/gluconolactonase/LRE family protein [Streptomyces sp. NPDC058045]|uniref:SMP-30/gluconolactonase/LRE family protein n=1 Tax=Streptomyces sp. NPDC058045 TaxID=3346311 RepID=UPI0036E172D3
MLASDPQLLLDQLYFPECLRWHDGELWFSDMFAGTVHRMCPEEPGSITTVVTLDDLCGGLGWLPNGDLLAVSMEKRHLVAVGKNGGIRLHADLSGYFEHSINDMLVLPNGRAVVGGFGFDADNGAAPATVPLAVVEPDGSHRLDENQLLFPNGIEVIAPGKVAVAETFADRITTMTLEDTGHLGAATSYAELREGDGPDGISADGNGGLWVACAFGERVLHLDESGGIDSETTVAGMGVFDCLFDRDNNRLVIAISGHDEVHGRSHRTGALLMAPVVPHSNNEETLAK